MIVNKLMKKFLMIFCVLLTGLSACKKDDTSDFDTSAQEFKDDALIQAYLKAHNINAVQDPSGLYYQVVTQGTGSYPTAASNVTVGYTGTLLDGTVFDSNSLFTTAMTSVVRGWTIGLQHVKAGGEIILYIPSDLGYANVATGSIPASSVLIFDIKLISIN